MHQFPQCLTRFSTRKRRNRGDAGRAYSGVCSVTAASEPRNTDFGSKCGRLFYFARVPRLFSVKTYEEKLGTRSQAFNSSSLLRSSRFLPPEACLPLRRAKLPAGFARVEIVALAAADYIAPELRRLLNAGRKLRHTSQWRRARTAKRGARAVALLISLLGQKLVKVRRWSLTKFCSRGVLAERVRSETRTKS